MGTPPPLIDEDDDNDANEASTAGAETQRHSLCLSAGGRIDKVLAAALPDLSRARIQALIAAGHVVLDGVVVRAASAAVVAGQMAEVTLPPVVAATPTPEAIPLTILYEDDHLIVLDKPAGMVVHPAPGHGTGTLVNALLAHCGGSLSGIGGVRRPGIVHRLDRETSGLMIVAKTDAAHRALSAQLADRSLARRYIAFCWGLPDPASGVIDTPMGRDPRDRLRMAVVEGGKAALTRYRVTERLGPDALPLLAAELACDLETGRTHQIRVHLSHLGHGLIGDPLYARSAAERRGLRALKPFPELLEAMMTFPRQALHAARLAFVHPHDGRPMELHAPLPADMRALRDRLAASRDFSLAN